MITSVNFKSKNKQNNTKAKIKDSTYVLFHMCNKQVLSSEETLHSYRDSDDVLLIFSSQETLLCDA